MAAKLPLKSILERIGHDGSEVIWPDLPEPHRRRAFHIAECTHAVWPDFAVTECPLIARLSPDGERIYEIKMHPEILEYEWTGVWTGKRLKSGIRHAVAYENGRWFDPVGIEYDDFRNHFEPETFWRLDVILTSDL